MGSQKPVIAVSRCFLQERCRYNAELLKLPGLDRLLKPFIMLPICPEVEIGLGVPRPPIRLEQHGDAIRLMRPSDGLDLTERMLGFADQRLKQLGQVDGFVLKARSPSCGVRDTALFLGATSQRRRRRTAGLFAASVLASFPGYPVEDEGRLTEARWSDHFLTRVFLLAGARQPTTAEELVRFHRRQRGLIGVYNQRGVRRLERLLAAPMDFERQRETYRNTLATLIRRRPRRRAWVDAFRALFGTDAGQEVDSVLRRWLDSTQSPAALRNQLAHLAEERELNPTQTPLLSPHSLSSNRA